MPDPSTFEAEALQHLDDVARFARALTRDPADADDLVQDTYLLALKGRHTWRPDADMRRWLFAICKHAFLRRRSREARFVDEPTDATGELMASVRGHADLVASGNDDLFDRIDVGPAIRAALELLPDPFRAVVVLVDCQGFTYGDVAEQLDVPVGTVRSRLFRARRLLQELLVAHARDAGVLRPSTPTVAEVSS